MVDPLRVPISVASRRGVSWLNEQARERRVILTRFGRADTVVDTAARLDETAAKIDRLRAEILEHFLDKADQRAKYLDLDDVCGRLGLDIGAVRAAAGSGARTDAHGHSR